MSVDANNHANGRFVDMTGWVMAEHGVPDSRWTVLSYAGHSKWVCECNCENKTIKTINGGALREGSSKSCGCYNKEVARNRRLIDMTGWVMKDHGVPRSLLTVVEQVGYSKDRDTLWRCNCECGNETISNGYSIRTGGTLSCGCWHLKAIAENGKKNRKGNVLDTISFDYGIGWTSNTNQEFYFDLDDEDIVRKHTWGACTDHYGYTRVETNVKIDGKYRRKSLAQILTGKDDIDHEDRNPFNNRRYNLKERNRSVQCINQKLKSNNTSGVTGVYWDKIHECWIANMKKDGKDILRNYYHNFKDAVIARLQKEAELFGDKAPQAYLFEQYGILLPDKDGVNE